MAASKSIDYDAKKALAKDFLRNYSDSLGDPKYLDILQELANRKMRAIYIDLEDIYTFCKDSDEDFWKRVKHNTRRYINLFTEAIDEIMPQPTEVFSVDEDCDVLMTQRVDQGADSQDNLDPLKKMPAEIKHFFEVYIRIFKDMKDAAKDTPSTIREVKAEHIGELVMISGIITRCLDVKPLMQVAVYTCEDCDFEIYQVASGVGIDSVGNYVDDDNNVNGVRKYSSVAAQSKLKSVSYGDISDNAKCKLLHWFVDGVVAEGRIASTDPKVKVHHVPLCGSCWKVGLIEFLWRRWT